MKTDRSGRNLMEYRELYWDEKKLRKEKTAIIDEVRDYASVMFNGAHRDIAKKLIRIVKLKDLEPGE
jgi:hypothetical protein